MAPARWMRLLWWMVALLLWRCEPPGPGQGEAPVPFPPDTGEVLPAAEGGLVARWNNRVVFVSEHGGLKVFDISDPSHVTTVGVLPVRGVPLQLGVVDGQAWVLTSTSQREYALFRAAISETAPLWLASGVAEGGLPRGMVDQDGYWVVSEAWMEGGGRSTVHVDRWTLEDSRLVQQSRWPVQRGAASVCGFAPGRLWCNQGGLLQGNSLSIWELNAPPEVPRWRLPATVDPVFRGDHVLTVRGFPPRLAVTRLGADGSLPTFDSVPVPPGSLTLLESQQALGFANDSGTMVVDIRTPERPVLMGNLPVLASMVETGEDVVGVPLRDPGTIHALHRGSADARSVFLNGVTPATQLVETRPGHVAVLTAQHVHALELDNLGTITAREGLTQDRLGLVACAVSPSQVLVASTDVWSVVSLDDVAHPGSLVPRELVHAVARDQSRLAWISNNVLRPPERPLLSLSVDGPLAPLEDAAATRVFVSAGRVVVARIFRATVGQPPHPDTYNTRVSVVDVPDGAVPRLLPGVVTYGTAVDLRGMVMTRGKLAVRVDRYTGAGGCSSNGWPYPTESTLDVLDVHAPDGVVAQATLRKVDHNAGAPPPPGLLEAPGGRVLLIQNRPEEAGVPGTVVQVDVTAQPPAVVRSDTAIRVDAVSPDGTSLFGKLNSGQGDGFADVRPDGLFFRTAVTLPGEVSGVVMGDPHTAFVAAAGGLVRFRETAAGSVEEVRLGIQGRVVMAAGPNLVAVAQEPGFPHLPPTGMVAVYMLDENAVPRALLGLVRLRGWTRDGDTVWFATDDGLQSIRL